MFENVLFYLRHPALLLSRVRNGPRFDIDVERLAALLSQCPTVIEAGAAGGEDTVVFAAQWPLGKIYAFEPVPSAFARLSAAVGHLNNVKVFNEAISVSDGVVEMYISSRKTDPDATDSSSVLRPAEQLKEWPEIIFSEVHMANAVTLKTFVHRERLGSVDLLWLDMQGYELACLEASHDILEIVDRIYLEVSFRRFYKGTPLYPEVKRKLGKFGFRPELELVGPRGGNALFKKK